MTLAAIDTDVVIVGAGPAGSALAMMLGQAGVKAVLLDRSRFPRDKTCGEGLMPAGVKVLEALEVPLAQFPSLRGVTYRVPRAGSASGEFMDGKTGRGVRRLEFDRLLAERAAAARNVEARYGCEALGIELQPSHIEVKTVDGTLTARFAVGADGVRSRVARWVGWSRPPRPPHRYALVGHVESPAHKADRVLVTLLDGCEVYTAPTGPDELLVAVLGSKSGLRADGEPVRDAYARHVCAAHQDVRIPADAAIHGAGPFWVRPATVAERRVALIGDAAGFLDPLTGDGMSDALVAARKLAQLVASDVPDPLRAYRRWEAGQWRRRVFVNRLALTLTGSSLLARRALRRLRQRPSTLNRLLEVNDGTRSLWSLSLRDWSTLAGV
jgi:flavin-dependent dehydrogenase